MNILILLCEITKSSIFQLIIQNRGESLEEKRKIFYCSVLLVCGRFFQMLSPSVHFRTAVVFLSFCITYSYAFGQRHKSVTRAVSEVLCSKITNWKKKCCYVLDIPPLVLLRLNMFGLLTGGQWLLKSAFWYLFGTITKCIHEFEFMNASNSILTTKHNKFEVFFYMPQFTSAKVTK